MTKTAEERISSLEDNFTFMGEGIRRVEKALEKLDATVATLVEKLDTRYPSRESVDLRMGELVRDIKKLREDQDALEARTTRMSAWQYKVTGALVLIAFALGVASHFWGW